MVKYKPTVSYKVVNQWYGFVEAISMHYYNFIIIFNSEIPGSNVHYLWFSSKMGFKLFSLKQTFVFFDSNQSLLWFTL